jgi:NADH-quinone oxidoreductase subunit M
MSLSSLPPGSLLDAAVFAPLVGGALLLLAGRHLERAWQVIVANLAALPALLQLGFLLAEGRHGAESPLGGFLLEPLGAALFAMTVLVGAAALHRALRQLGQVESPHLYLGLVLILWSGTLGAFASPLSSPRGVLAAYVYHEFALIPTFVLTLLWGGEGRRSAAMQMAITLTLGAMVGLTGLFLCDFQPSHAEAPAIGLILLGFGTLVSLFPFHSWAAPIYAAAPSPAAMLHAGALKKFGLAVIAAFCVGRLGPWSEVLLWLALGNTVLLGAVCLAQRDLKQLVSWSSVAHMGPIFLGLWVADRTGKPDGLVAAAVLMTAHGLAAAALFSLANDVRARAGTYRLDELGGLAARTPVLAALFIAATMASIGLPGFGNFWGELGVFLSLRDQSLWIQAAAASTIVISAIYMLRATAGTFHGPLRPELAAREGVTDLGWADRAGPLALLGASLAIGCYPALVTRLFPQ